jgi:hypothetical protein
MMIGTLIVSLCPVALPVLCGILLSAQEDKWTFCGQLLSWSRFYKQISMKLNEWRGSGGYTLDHNGHLSTR